MDTNVIFCAKVRRGRSGRLGGLGGRAQRPSVHARRSASQLVELREELNKNE